MVGNTRGQNSSLRYFLRNTTKKKVKVSVWWARRPAQHKQMLNTARKSYTQTNTQGSRNRADIALALKNHKKCANTKSTARRAQHTRLRRDEVAHLTRQAGRARAETSRRATAERRRAQQSQQATSRLHC